MANDYISRETALSKKQRVETSNGWLRSFVEPCDIVSLPAADVVPVVRCKDCTHWHASKNGWGDCYHIADRDLEGGASFDCSTESEDFCSYGACTDKEAPNVHPD